MSLPLTLEAILCLAVDRLRSSQGLEIEEFIQEHPDHAADLQVLLPALVEAGEARWVRAVESECLTALCEMQELFR